MPGLPAAGGWGGSGRTLGIKMDGFTDEEISKAVDYCDNDKVKTLKYLAKLKEKNGAYNWKPEVEKLMPSLDSQMRGLCQKLLTYDNVPNKQKTFVNFSKNSLALLRQPQLAEKLWEAIGHLLRKPAQEAAAPVASQEDDASKEEADDEQPQEDTKPKKKKKDKKPEASTAEEAEEAEEPVDKKKKKKKAKAEDDSADAEEEAAQAAPKKDKKKKKSRDDEDEEEASPDADHEDAAEESQPKKKDGKPKRKPSADDDDAMETEPADKGGAAKRKRPAHADDDDDSSEEPAAAAAAAAAASKKKKADGASKAAPAAAAGGKAGGGGGGQFDFYKEPKAVSAATDADVQQYRESLDIKVENCDLKPIRRFDDAPFDEDLMACCAGFDKPTAIQSQCWPICLSGRDLVGIAATGSGKTLGFGLPGLTHIKRLGLAGSKTPVMLVVAPTRELAMQSAVVLEKAGEGAGITTVCVYGGVSKHEQKAALRTGVQVLVATPGRLLDLMQEKACNVKCVSYLVLDEADRMLDLGFEKDIRTIIADCRPDRQTLMFSATWPMSIQAIASEFLRRPARITVGSAELSANHRVKQIIEVIEPAGKDRRVVELLAQYHKGRKNRIIIFVLYKKEADRVHSLIESKGFKVQAIHGDRSQEARSKAMEEFKKGTIPLLIATDVAARGLDIPDVEYVINYSFPLTTEDYVHRIGRTGRAGKEGVSHTFFTNFDKPRAGELVNVLREANQEVPESLTKFGTHVKKKEHKLFGAHFKDVDMSVKASKVTFDSDSE